jgi:outer membrane protein OmpA-like peptidoglycan-associated protein
MRPFILSTLILLAAGHARAQTSALPVGTGLQASYYDGINFDRLVARRRDAAVDFDWQMQPPVPGLGSEYFSVRWEGYLLAPVTGDYDFTTVMDDGLRVWVGGKRIINAWREQDHVPAAARIHLEAGRYYRLRVEYFQTIRDTRALLRWQMPNSVTSVPVSGAFLFTALPPSAKPIPKPEPKPAPAPAVAARLTPAVAARPQPTITPTRPAQVVGRRPRPTPPAPVRQAAPDPAAGRVATVAVPPPAAAPAPDSLPDLSTLTKGTAVELKNLYFEQGKARLLPTSQPELNRLVRVLRSQPALQFEIAGHTDNVGDTHKNQQLSEQRARVVRAYLVQRGIDSLRLSAVGYGGSRPVADNRDPQQRPRNRRVELVAR